MKSLVAKTAIYLVPLWVAMTVLIVWPFDRAGYPTTGDYQLSNSVTLRMEFIVLAIRDGSREKGRSSGGLKPLESQTELWSDISPMDLSMFEKEGYYDPISKKMMDMWGGELRPILIGGKVCAIVSSGPDRVFEWGGGDDLTVCVKDAPDRAFVDMKSEEKMSIRWGPKWVERHRFALSRVQIAALFLAGSVVAALSSWLASKIRRAPLAARPSVASRES